MICFICADKSRLRITPKYKERDVGESVKFECLTRKRTFHKVKWIFNQGDVHGYARLENPWKSVLKIDKVFTNHSGTYTCRGYQMPHGKIETFLAKAELKVFGECSIIS